MTHARQSVYLLACALLAACAAPPPDGSRGDGAATERPQAAVANARLSIESSLKPKVSIEGLASEGLADKMRRLGIQQVSVAVYRQGALEWANAYGSAADSETLFQAASMSKLVAATGIAMLAKAHGHSLDADISAALADLDLAELNPEKVPITLRGLLSHTNGATVGGFAGYPTDALLPRNLDVVRGSPPSQSPAVRIEADKVGTFVYSGGGFQIAQLWAEQVSGEAFASLMQRLILAPLGMQRSTFDQPLGADLSNAGNIAPAYTEYGEIVEGRWRVYPEQASAGLWTTPTDYGRFLMALLRAAQGDPGAGLDPEVAAEVIRPVANQYGLGVEVTTREGTTVISHAGGNEGYRCYFEGFVETGDAIISMSGSPAAFGLNEDIVRTAHEVYALPAPDTRRAERIMLSADALSAFAGRYPLPDGQRAVHIRAMPPDLAVISPTGTHSTLVPISTHRFINPDDAQEVSFSADSQDRMTLMVGDARLPRETPRP